MSHTGDIHCEEVYSELEEIVEDVIETHKEFNNQSCGYQTILAAPGNENYLPSREGTFCEKLQHVILLLLCNTYI